MFAVGRCNSYQLKNGVRKPMLGLCIGGNAQEPDIEAREVAPPPADKAYAHESTSARVGARAGAPCRVLYQAASLARMCHSGRRTAGIRCSVLRDHVVRADHQQGTAEYPQDPTTPSTL